MSEPGPQLQANAPDAQARLWDKAPAWRTLTVTASLLTLAAVATPLLLPERPAKPAVAANADKMLLPRTPQTPTPNNVALAEPPAPAAAPQHAAAQPQPAQAACNLAMPTTPQPQRPGTVVAFVNPTESAVQLQRTERVRGALIDPAWRAYPRVVVRGDNGSPGRFTVPPGLHVAIGDRVTVQSPYRNMALACNFTPALLTADLGPAARTATPPDSAPPPPPPPITDTLTTPLANAVTGDESHTPATPP